MSHFFIERYELRMRVLTSLLVVASMSLVLASLSGCSKVRRAVSPTWHGKFGWVAEEYFDDPSTIALCNAIQANDLDEIERLVAQGADVNDKGKGNMTPLLWAFPDGKLERFKKLLELGADPNVIISSDFGTGTAIPKGASVTHLASGTAFDGYFEAVFDHGGDPNLEAGGSEGDTPIFGVIERMAGDKEAKIRRLAELGADLDVSRDGFSTPATLAGGFFGQYDLAIAILDCGADPAAYNDRRNTRLIHSLLGERLRLQTAGPKQRRSYERLLKILEDQGQTLDDARADQARWSSWSGSIAKKAKLRRAEVAARKQREREQAEREKKAKDEADEGIDAEPR